MTARMIADLPTLTRLDYRPIEGPAGFGDYVHLVNLQWHEAEYCLFGRMVWRNIRPCLAASSDRRGAADCIAPASPCIRTACPDVPRKRSGRLEERAGVSLASPPVWLSTGK